MNCVPESYVLSPGISCTECNSSYSISTAFVVRVGQFNLVQVLEYRFHFSWWRHPSQPSVNTSYISTSPGLPVHGGTNQGLHGSVKSMLVVASELWVGTLERWVSASLWLLDTIVGLPLAFSWCALPYRCRFVNSCFVVEGGPSYPLR